jgi:acetyltransferase-like isoleucine patch superfamily enzyme
VISWTLATAARLATGHRYRALSIGTGSRVTVWRCNAKSGNVLHVGAHSLMASRIVYERPGAALSVGSRSFVGLGLMSIAERVEIGDHVMLSWGVTVVDHNSHSILARERAKDTEQWLKGRKDWAGIKIAPVEIRDHAWLGFNVSVLPGVVIGEGAIVGAGALVTKSVPAWTIAAGNPARVLRELRADERI